MLPSSSTAASAPTTPTTANSTALPSDAVVPNDLGECASGSGDELGPGALADHGKLRVFWEEWLRPFLLILLVLLSFRSAIADWNHVPTGSMRPTILEGDRIFVNKIAYDLRVPFTTRRLAQWSQPVRGDIVVFLSPADGKRLVKRVVGVPGDRIELRRHRLEINGRRATYQRVDPDSINYLDEAERTSYRIDNESIAGVDGHPIMTRPWFSGRSTFSPITLAQGQFFVMGDNRDDSADSRVFGVVQRDLILGKATGVAMSVDPEQRYRPRWDRFFQGFNN